VDDNWGLQHDFEKYWRNKFALEIESYIYDSPNKVTDDHSKWFHQGMVYAMMLLRHSISDE
jgi:hypothetical protein